jgi:hypothetical protein
VLHALALLVVLLSHLRSCVLKHKGLLELELWGVLADFENAAEQRRGRLRLRVLCGVSQSNSPRPPVYKHPQPPTSMTDASSVGEASRPRTTLMGHPLSSACVGVGVDCGVGCGVWVGAGGACEAAPLSLKLLKLTAQHMLP